jgi:hypothetical protein
MQFSDICLAGTETIAVMLLLSCRTQALAVSAGSRLTPEQQMAQQLQLPLTLRIRSQPGAPNERQLMERIKAAETWQQLEVLLFKYARQRQRPRAAGSSPDNSSSPAAPVAAAGADAAAAAMPGSGVADAQAPATQQQQQDSKTPQQKRRRQQPQPLSVQVQPQLQQPQQQQQQQQDSKTPQQKRRRQQPQPLSVQVQPQLQLQQPQPQPILLQVPADGAAAAVPQPKPSDVLNYLHVTEAFRRLTQLLPSNPTTLHPTERARAAALIEFLSAQALALAQTLELDPRGIAHVAAAVTKLGHKDEALAAELQTAALLQVEAFSAQHVAMLLGALVSMRAR